MGAGGSLESVDLSRLTQKERRAFKRKRAKEMRAHPTPSEARLWSLLKNRQIIGAKFRNQVVVPGGYIADFLCPSHWLIVEVDGAYHDTDRQRVLDAVRDSHLAEAGYKVLRFKNEDLAKGKRKRINRVLRVIELELRRQEACGKGIAKQRIQLEPRKPREKPVMPVALPPPGPGRLALRHEKERMLYRPSPPIGPTEKPNPIKLQHEWQYQMARASYVAQRNKGKKKKYRQGLTHTTTWLQREKKWEQGEADFWRARQR